MPKIQGVATHTHTHPMWRLSLLMYGLITYMWDTTTIFTWFSVLVDCVRLIIYMLAWNCSASRCHSPHHFSSLSFQMSLGGSHNLAFPLQLQQIVGQFKSLCWENSFVYLAIPEYEWQSTTWLSEAFPPTNEGFIDSMYKHHWMAGSSASDPLDSPQLGSWVLHSRACLWNYTASTRWIFFTSSQSLDSRIHQSLLLRLCDCSTSCKLSFIPKDLMMYPFVFVWHDVHKLLQAPYGPPA